MSEWRMGMGVVGLGGRGREIAEAIRRHPQLRLLAVFDSDDARVDEFVRNCGDPDLRGYRTVEEMAADRRLGGACICSPPAAHPEQAAALIATGMHLIIEKPLARDRAGADLIREADRRTPGGTHIVGSALLLFQPAVAAARQCVRAGELGEVFHVEAVYLHKHRPRGWFVDPAISGGGVLNDLAFHPLQVINHILPVQYDRVRASLRTREPGLEVEDTADLLIDANAGRVSIGLSLAWNAPARVGVVRWFGSRGIATLDLVHDRFTLDEGGTERIVYASSEQRPDLTSRLLNHFRDCITHRQENYGDLGSAIAIQELIAQAYEQFPVSTVVGGV